MRGVLLALDTILYASATYSGALFAAVYPATLAAWSASDQSTELLKHYVATHLQPRLAVPKQLLVPANVSKRWQRARQRPRVQGAALLALRVRSPGSNQRLRSLPSVTLSSLPSATAKSPVRSLIWQCDDP